MHLITSDKDSELEEEATLPPRKKALKLSKVRTTYSSVLHKVTWPHEVVYTAMGKPAEYEGISIPLFISGYLPVMVTEKPSVHPPMV